MEMEDLSQASDAYIRKNQVDFASALRGSISFGRFLSESLDWEKWSAFNHNKLLEEAKNCSVPGSVAKKRAYFEAHYRRPASLKLPTKLKHENNKTNTDLSCPNAENKEPKINNFQGIEVENEDQKNQTSLEIPTTHGGGHFWQSLQVKTSNIVQNNENVAVSKSYQHDKRVIKEVSSTSHKNEDQNIKKSVDAHEEANISSSSASRIWKIISKENKPPQNRMDICSRPSDRRKPISGLLHMSVNSNFNQKGQKSSLGSNQTTNVDLQTCSSGQKLTFSTPYKQQKSLKGQIHAPSMISAETRFGASSSRRKASVNFFPHSISCFSSPSTTENKHLHDGSTSSNIKSYEKILMRKAASSNLAISSSTSGALSRSSCRRNKL